jgi:hypothetical protein
MITMRQLRPWLFVALLIAGYFAIAVALTLHVPRIVAWMVLHGFRGIWGRVSLIAMVLVALLLVSEASLRLAYLGARIPERPGAAKTLAFSLSYVGLTLAWMVAAHFLAPLLQRHVVSGPAAWLETLLVVIGALAIAAAADRVAPRLGIHFGRRSRP